MNKFKLIINFILDRYHLLFKSAAINHLRLQDLIKNSDGSYQATLRFSSYTQLKNYQKKLRRVTVSLSSAVAMIAVAFIVAPYVMNPNRSSAANYQFKQTAWDGTPDQTPLPKTPDTGDWASYVSAGTDAAQLDFTKVGDGEVKLKSQSGSVTQNNNGTSRSGFNLAGSSFFQTEVTPNGTDGQTASVQLAVSTNQSIDIAQSDDSSTVPTKTNQAGGFKMPGSVFADTVLVGTQQGASVKLDMINQTNLSSESYHNCAVKTDGNVYCWGYNSSGQIGIGNTLDQKIPVKVSGLSDIKSVDVDDFSSCALKNDGTVYCWGANDGGQLGIGNTSAQSYPVQIPNFTGVSSIAAGGKHVCALKTDNTVYCWGLNSQGDLGIGNTTQKNSPVQIPNFSDVNSIYSGNSNTCAIKTDGTVYCWGNNTYGQLATGNTTAQYSPVQMSGFTGASSISIGSGQICALKADSKVYCIGSNGYGQLGNGNTTSQNTPVQVSNLSGVVSVAAGSSHTCALKSDGTLWCWGYNTNGQLGNGNTTNKNVPVQVLNFTSGSVIAAGSNHTCALKSDGTIFCWGSGSQGQLGNGELVYKSTPVQIFSIINKDYSKLSLGYNHTCAVKTDGTSFCWGDNRDGQLGNGNKINGNSPVQISNINDVSSVASGNMYSCALTSNGAVYCWGSNGYDDPDMGVYDVYGNLGNGLPYDQVSPVQISGFTNAKSISSGTSHVCALKTDGNVYCWGYNNAGQLGNGNNVNQTTPVQVSGLSDVNSVSAGSSHTCALKNDGTVYCWGFSNVGQLGNGSTTFSFTPVKVTNLTNIISISASSDHTCALKIDGKVFCWGANGYGQLGNGNIINQTTPVQVSGLSSVISISSGLGHTCSLDAYGNVYCWGFNSSGQLGNGNTTNQSTPVIVGSGINGVIAIAAGGNHTCALKAGSNIFCWGMNASGQLGNGTTTNSSTPVQINSLSLGNTYLSSIRMPAYKASGTYIAYFDSEKNGQDWSTLDLAKNDSAGTSNTRIDVKVQASDLASQPAFDASGNCNATNISANAVASLDVSGCAGSGRYLWYKVTLFASPDASASPLLDSATGTLVTKIYQTSGTYISGSIDTGQRNFSWGNLPWTQNLDGGTIGFLLSSSTNGSDWTNFKGIDGSDQTDCSAGQCYTINTGQQINAVHNGARYIKYKAFLSSPDSKKTPQLNAIVLNYNYYPTTFKKLISSPFDSLNVYNSLANLSWTKATGGNTKFQIRTAPDNGSGAPDWTAGSGWCGTGGAAQCDAPLNNAPGNVQSFYTQGDPINSTQSDAAANRWFQYAIFLASSEGNDNAVLQDVTLAYAFNTPPQVSLVNTLTQSSDGTVPVTYKASEIAADKIGQTSDYAALFYQPDSTKKILLNNSINSTANTITFFNPDPANQPIPASGTILIDSELISYTSVTDPTSSTPVLTGVTRHLNFGGNASFPTQPSSHNGKVELPASAAEILFLGKNIGMVDATSDFEKSVSGGWNPKIDNPDLNNKKYDHFSLVVVASDGATYSSIGSVKQDLILDLQSPSINNVAADFSSISEPQKTSGIFGIGKTIPVKITFNEPVVTVGDLNIKVDMANGRVTNCVINIPDGQAVQEKTCNITVNANDLSNDLSLIAGNVIEGTIKDVFSNTTVNPAAPIKKDLHDSPDVKVDGVLPEVTSITEISNNANNKKAKPGDKVTLSINFSETLKQNPVVTIDGHAANVSGTGSNFTAEYSFQAANNNDLEGELPFTVDFIDQADNAGVQVTQNNANVGGERVVFDRTAPTISNIITISNNADNTKAKVGDTVTMTFLTSEELQNPTVKIGRAELVGSMRTATVTHVGLNYSATYILLSTDKEENLPYAIDFQDLAGNVGVSINGNSSVTFDKTAPTISESQKINTPTNNKTPQYSFASNEDGGITYGGGCASSTTNAINGSNVITLNLLDDGTYDTCTISVKDAAGNVSIPLVISTFKIDTVGTAITVNSPVANEHINATHAVDFNLGEDLRSGQISFAPVDGGATITQTFAGNDLLQGSHSKTVSGLIDGKTYTLSISGKDLAGNDMIDSQKTGIVFDNTAPTAQLSIPVFFNNYSDQSDVSYTVENNINGLDEPLKNVSLNFAPTGGNSAPVVDCFLTRNAPDLNVGAHNAINLQNSCLDNIILVDGAVYKISLKVEDKAGNASNSTLSDITYDKTPPQIVKFYSTSPNSTVDNPTGSGDIDLLVKYNEEITGGTLTAKVGPMSANVLANINQKISSSELKGSFTIGAPRTGYDTTPDALKIESVMAQSVTDRAGNVQEVVLSVIPDEQNLSVNGSNIVIDTTPPILQSFSIENAKVSGAYKAGETFTIAANYNKTIQAGGNITIKLNTGNSSHQITLTNSVASKKLTATYIVAEGENADQLLVDSVMNQNVLDGKGVVLNITGNIINGAYASSAGDPVNNLSGYIIDTQKPLSPVIAINKNLANENLTKDNVVKLSLGQEELHPFQMQFSNDGTSWCAPVPFAATYDVWDLLNSGCGGKNPTDSQTTETVFVRFIDKAGNISDPASDTIVYDNTKPVIISIVADKESGVYGPDTTVRLTATYSESIKSGSKLNLLLSNNIAVEIAAAQDGLVLEGTYVVGKTGSKEDSAKLFVKDNLISQNVIDDAGNVQNGLVRTGENIDKNKTIIIDTIAPTDNDMTIDRSSVEGEVKIKLSPDEANPLNTTADVQILSDQNAPCDFSDVSSQKNIAIDTNPKIVTFADNEASVKKACVKFKDYAGNQSGILTISTPETPANFAYTDISNPSIDFFGAFLTWQNPSFRGTSDKIESVELLDCQTSENSCIPGGQNTNTNSHIINYLNSSENYYTYNSREENANYCYRARFKNTNQDYSAYSQTLCYVAGQGSQITGTQVSITNNEGDITISGVTKTSANISFKTLDSAHINTPLPTKATISLYTDSSLSNEMAHFEDNADFKVVHNIPLTNLNSNTQYYVKITAMDFLGNKKSLGYSVTENTNLQFKTLGELTKISNISNPPAILSDTKAEITFDTDQDANCYIQYGTKSAVNLLTGAIDEQVYDPTWAMETKGQYSKKHAIHLTSLFTKTKYYYRIACMDSGQDSKNIITIYSFDEQTLKNGIATEGTFKTLELQMTESQFEGQADAVAPVISNVSLADVTGESATITWTTDEPANSSVAYETDGATFTKMEADYEVNSNQANYSTSHSITLNNLIPDTKYSFAPLSMDKNGNVAQANFTTMTTKAPSSLSSLKVVSTALGQATITWTTGSATSSIVEYGLTTSYDKTKQDSGMKKEHMIVLEDLTPGQTYHFRVKGEDTDKNIFASSDTTFQPKSPPVISDFKIDSITEHGALVKFVTNVPTDSLVTYNDAANAENSGFQGRPEVATKHEIILKNLASGVEYSLKVKVRDEDGNETEEAFPNFTTTKDTKPPVIERIKTDSALSQNDRVQAIISWTTDELSTGKVIYREGKNGQEKTFDVNSSPSYSHVGVITTFKPGVVYYFNVESVDAVGNLARSSDYALLTPQQKQNIIQIIIGNFTDIFGWAKFKN